MRWLLKRELAVSILNGLVLSILVGTVTYFWFGELILSLLISYLYLFQTFGIEIY